MSDTPSAANLRSSLRWFALCVVGIGACARPVVQAPDQGVLDSAAPRWVSPGPDFVVARSHLVSVFDGRDWYPEARYDVFAVVPAETEGWVRFMLETVGTNDHACYFRGMATRISEQEWVGIDISDPRSGWRTVDGLTSYFDSDACLARLEFHENEVTLTPLWRVGDNGRCASNCGSRMAPYPTTFDTMDRIDGGCEPDAQMSEPYAVGPDCDWNLLRERFPPMEPPPRTDETDPVPNGRP